MGILTPGEGSTWHLVPVIPTATLRVRPHMVALIEEMELHRAGQPDSISLRQEMRLVPPVETEPMEGPA